VPHALTARKKNQSGKLIPAMSKDNPLPTKQALDTGKNGI